MKSISLNEPWSVPSALAPLSPMMYSDERVVELAQLLDGVDDASDVVVGVLEEAREHLHLAREHGLELRRDLVPGGDALVPRA